MLMFGICKMVTGSQCLLSCVSIVLRLVSVGLPKVKMMAIINCSRLMRNLIFVNSNLSFLEIIISCHFNLFNFLVLQSWLLRMQHVNIHHN